MQITALLHSFLALLPSITDFSARNQQALSAGPHPPSRFHTTGKDCGDKPGSQVYEFNDTMCAQQPFRITELTAGQCLPLDPATESVGFEVNTDWAFGVWLYRDDSCEPNQRLIYYGRGPYYPCCNDIAWEGLKEAGPPRSLKYQG